MEAITSCSVDLQFAHPNDVVVWAAVADHGVTIYERSGCEAFHIVTTGAPHRRLV